MERKKLVAKFAGKCAECGVAIQKGEMVFWAKGYGVAHLACPKAAVAAPAAPNPVIVELQAAARRAAMKWGAEGYDAEFEEVEFERLMFAAIEAGRLPAGSL